MVENLQLSHILMFILHTLDIVCITHELHLRIAWIFY